MADFTKGICGCTNNCGLCVFTTFCPCYVEGKIAESVGKSCLLFGCLTLTPCNFISHTVVRSSVREKYGIEGSIIKDLCCHCCCPCCAMIQEGQEVIEKGDAPPGAMCMSRE